MANFFEGIWNAIKQPVDELKFIADKSVGIGEDLVKGKFSDAFSELKSIPGDHQEMMNGVTVPILGDNKLAKNSDAIAGTIVGGIMAAPAIAGGLGTSTAGGSASSSGISSVGTQGVSQATSATTTSSWFDTIMDGFDMLSSAGGDDSPENKAPQSEFSKGFSRMLEVQRELAATPPAKRNELMAKKNSEALANIFKPMFGEDK